MMKEIIHMVREINAKGTVWSPWRVVPAGYYENMLKIGGKEWEGAIEHRCFVECTDQRKIDQICGADHISNYAVWSALGEMTAQDRKWGAFRQQHPFIWSTILMEEAGELAQAILHTEFGGDHAGTIRAEAVQVAAVAIQLIEQLDREHAFEQAKSEYEAYERREL